MRVEYDAIADAAFVRWVEQEEGRVGRSHICDLEINEGAVILLFDEQDHLVGLEVLGASKLLPSELIRTSDTG